MAHKLSAFQQQQWKKKAQRDEEQRCSVEGRPVVGEDGDG